MTRIIKMILTVDEAAVGGLVADLSGRVQTMGFETVELVDKRTRKSQRGGTCADLIRAQLAKGPMRSAELIRITGIKKQSVYAALSALKKAKKVKQSNNGNWSLTR